MTDEVLRTLSSQLNNNPQDELVEDWGTSNLSSNYVMGHIDDVVGNYKKLFRRKKLVHEEGLTLYIYSYPSYQLFETIRVEPLLRECRGLIISPLGIRNRPFPVIPTIGWDDALLRAENEVATVKINGRMLTGLVTKKDTILIDKGGRAVSATKSLQQMRSLVNDADMLGLTVLFEVTDEENPLVLKVESGCHLVGMRSRRTGKMAAAADLIKIADQYNLLPLTIVDSDYMSSNEKAIEGVVFNNGDTIVRAKTPSFRKLQQITSVLRYNGRSDLAEVVPQVDEAVLQQNLTTRELDELKRRQLL